MSALSQKVRKELNKREKEVRLSYMTTKLSSKGQIVLPISMRRRLALQAGDALEVSLDSRGGQIVIAPQRKKRAKAKIIKDPLTGWPVLKGPSGTPTLTNEMVKEMLADFP